MINFKDVHEKYKECKRLVKEQPEEERSYYEPSLNVMMAVLTQPTIPTDILECIEKHADNLINRLGDKAQLTPAAISRLINSLPRYSDIFPD